MLSTGCEVCKSLLPADQLVTISGKSVCARCKPNFLMNLKSGVGTSSKISPQRSEEIRKKISRLNLLSFVFALPGIGLQVFGGALLGAMGPASHDVAGMILLLRLIGAPLVIAGLVCYALMKGRSGVLGLLGLLSCLGLIILHFLPKSCHHCGTSNSYGARECSNCGAPE